MDKPATAAANRRPGPGPRARVSRKGVPLKKIGVWVEEPRMEEWEEAAEAQGRTLSAWIRISLDDVALQEKVRRSRGVLP